MEKVITFAIPAYNAERYLDKCLQSLTSCSSYWTDKIEIIIVNDGSTDQTATIAQSYISRYPNSIILINKENGGHGSGINTAIQQANGKYFKVVDADDWVVTHDLPRIIELCENIYVDVFISSFQTIDLSSGKIINYPVECNICNQIIGIDELLTVYSAVGPCCSFHGIMYRTEMYRQSQIMLTENIFYEDNEYATLPFIHVSRVFLLPIYFYQYLIGNSDQSVAAKNQVKRIHHIELVIKRLIKSTREYVFEKEATKRYFYLKISAVVVSYFVISLIKNPQKSAGRKTAESMYQLIQLECYELLPYIEKKYRILRCLNRLHVPASFYQMLLDSTFYKKLRSMHN